MKFFPTAGRVLAALTALLCAGPGVPVTAQEPMPAPCSNGCIDLSGTWDCGSWTSGTSGHSGRLRARITRQGPNCYRCVFCGTFLKIVPFRYPVTLQVTGSDGSRVYFRASRTLPLFGGTFTCTGSATQCSFAANYTSPQDSGTFRLSR